MAQWAWPQRLDDELGAEAGKRLQSQHPKELLRGISDQLSCSTECCKQRLLWPGPLCMQAPTTPNPSVWREAAVQQQPMVRVVTSSSTRGLSTGDRRRCSKAILHPFLHNMGGEASPAPAWHSPITRTTWHAASQRLPVLRPAAVPCAVKAVRSKAGASCTNLLAAVLGFVLHASK